MSLHAAAPKTQAETALALEFAGLPADAERARAFAVFEARGLPSRREEAWHYTDLRGAWKEAAPLAPAPDAARLAAGRQRLAELPEARGARLALVDGRYVAELSDAIPAGVTLSSGGAAAANDSVSALNAAFSEKPLSLAATGAAALEIVHLDGPGAVYSRVALSVAAGAEVTVFERFEGGSAGTQRNAATSATLAEGARCVWTTLIGDDAGLHLESQRVELAAGASYANFALVAGGAFVRRELDVGHTGPGAKIALAGLSLIDGKRLGDTTLTVRHAAPRGESREFYRHIVADEGRGVYQGKVIVAQHAQKTDGGMKSQALLLSPTAEMNNKPELEIFADDVVCGHGATVGALDPEQLFYLRARGLPAREAEAMLLEAFGAEAIERVADGAVADLLRERLGAWLKGRAA